MMVSNSPAPSHEPRRASGSSDLCLPKSGYEKWETRNDSNDIMIKWLMTFSTHYYSTPFLSRSSNHHLPEARSQTARSRTCCPLSSSWTRKVDVCEHNRWLPPTKKVIRRPDVVGLSMRLAYTVNPYRVLVLILTCHRLRDIQRWNHGII